MRTPPFAEGSAEGRGALENKFLLPQGVKDCKCKNCKSFEFEASGTYEKKKKKWNNRKSEKDGVFLMRIKPMQKVGLNTKVSYIIVSNS